MWGSFGAAAAVLLIGVLGFTGLRPWQSTPETEDDGNAVAAVDPSSGDENRGGTSGASGLSTGRVRRGEGMAAPPAVISPREGNHSSRTTSERGAGGRLVTIAGLVDLEGEPQAGASVRLYRIPATDLGAWQLYTQLGPEDPLRSTETERGGRFAFKGIPRGRYSVTALTQAGAGSLGPLVIQEDDAGVADLKLELTRGRSLRGRCFTPDGERLRPGGELTLWYIDGSHAYCLAPWRIHADVQADGAFVLQPVLKEIFDPDFFFAAVPGHFVEKIEGWARGEFVSVLLQRAASVEGKLADRDGQPIPGATVLAFACLSRVHTTCKLAERGSSDEAGKFHLSSLRPGGCVLTVEAPGFAATEPIHLEVPDDGLQLDPIVLVKGLSIRGRAERQGKAAPRAFVYGFIPDQPDKTDESDETDETDGNRSKRVSYFDSQALRRPYPGFFVVETDRAGRFETPPLPEGREIFLSGSMRDLPIGGGPGRSRRPPVAGKPGEDDVVVQLPEEDSVLAGTVVRSNGKRAAFATVRIKTAEEPMGLAATADQSGRFEFPPYWNLGGKGWVPLDLLAVGPQGWRGEISLPDPPGGAEKLKIVLDQEPELPEPPPEPDPEPASREGAAPPLPSGKVRLLGQIIDAETGAPIAGARVSRSQPRSERHPDVEFAETDGNGELVLAGFPAGSFCLHVWAEGYQQRPLEVTFNGTSDERVRFELHRPRKRPPSRRGTAVLWGIVTDERGQPLEGAHVSVRRRNASGGLGTNTNAAGQYRFEKLRPGGYEVSAECETQQLAAERRLEAQVLPTGETHLDIQLERLAATTLVVTGQVVTEEGTPLAGASVMIGAAWTHASGKARALRLSGDLRKTVKADAEGMFLAQGTCEGAAVDKIEVYSWLSTDAAYYVLEDKNRKTAFDGSPLRLVFTRRQKCKVRLHVKKADGTPASNCKWAFYRPGGGGGRSVCQDPRGVIESVIQEEAYVIIATETQPDIKEHIVCTSGETIELTLRPQPPGEVEGVLVDREGQPLAGVTVALDDEEGEVMCDPRCEPLAAKTDESGRFTIGNLPPGEYMVFGGRNSDGTRVVCRVESNRVTTIRLVRS